MDPYMTAMMAAQQQAMMDPMGMGGQMMGGPGMNDPMMGGPMMGPPGMGDPRMGRRNKRKLTPEERHEAASMVFAQVQEEGPDSVPPEVLRAAMKVAGQSGRDPYGMM
jgi:hypothetical protein